MPEERIKTTCTAGLPAAMIVEANLYTPRMISVESDSLRGRVEMTPHEARQLADALIRHAAIAESPP